MLKISDGFDFRPDQTSLLSYLPLTYNNVENVVDTIASSFLIVSSSNLQVTRTAIESRMTSNSGDIHPLTSELPALERRKKCCAFSFDQIFFKLQSSISGQIELFALELLALERRKYFPYTYNGENVVDRPSFFIVSSSNLQYSGQP